MKNFKVLFVTLCSIVFLVSSCNLAKDEMLSEPLTDLQFSELEEGSEEWLRYVEEKGKDIIVEHTTLEELNEYLTQNGLKPLTKEMIKEVQKNRSAWSCYYWNFFGDFNGDGVLNSSDFGDCYFYLCNTQAGCYGPAKTNAGSFLNHEARNFGRLSYLGNGTGKYVLDLTDFYAAQVYIIGASNCY